MSISLMKGTIFFVFILAVLFLSPPAFAQAPLKGKAVVIYPSADLWTLKSDKSMVRVESLSMGQELKLLPGSEKGSLKGITYSLLKVKLESGKEGYVNESLVAREPTLGAVTSNTANFYSQPRDSAVLPTILPLGSFAALWPAEGKPDYFLVSAYIKSAGAFYKDRYILASDVSVRPSDVSAALLLLAAEGMAQESQKQKLLETIEKKYADTVFTGLVDNLRRALTPPDALAVVRVSGSFSVQARLNLRDRPSTVAKVITLLKEKDIVLVDARTAEKASVGKDTDYWYRVISPVQGWVYGAFLAPVSPSTVTAAPSPSSGPASAPRQDLASVPGTESAGMAYVPSGTFTMGDTAGNGPRDNDERPLHEVTVKGFFIGKTEVTQAEWEALIGDNPSRFEEFRRLDPSSGTEEAECIRALRHVRQCVRVVLGLVHERSWRGT